MPFFRFPRPSFPPAAFFALVALGAALPASAMPLRDAYRIALASPVTPGTGRQSAHPVAVSSRAKVFLLRWNPAISSFTPEGFAETVAFFRENGRDGFNWSVREIERVRSGDIALFCRVGTDADRIDGVGVFTGATRMGASWRGDGTRVGYADLLLDFVQDPEEPILFPAEELDAAFPGIDWHGGPSGIALEETAAEALAFFVAQRLSSLLPDAFDGEIAPRAEFLWNLSCRLLSGACPALLERVSSWGGTVEAADLPIVPDAGMRLGYDPWHVSPAGFSERDLKTVEWNWIPEPSSADGCDE